MTNLDSRVIKLFGEDMRLNRLNKDSIICATILNIS